MACDVSPVAMFLMFRKTQIATSWKQHFLSPKLNSEHTFQFKLYLKTGVNSPQKPLITTQKYFFGQFFEDFFQNLVLAQLLNS